MAEHEPDAVTACAKIGLADAARTEIASRTPAQRTLRALRSRGVRYTARRVVEEVAHLRPSESPPAAAVAPLRRRPPPDGEELGLRPGEVVEVKSADEILETLDERGMQRGLLFMSEMWRYSGHRMVVMKRIDSIMIESTSTLKTGIRNTVLLEGACCDGSAHGGCGANCYHLWREAWLRRVGDGE